MLNRELIRKSLQGPFGTSLLAPVVITLIIAGTAIVLFIVSSSAQLDRLGTERQTSIVAASLTALRGDVVRQQMSVVAAAGASTSAGAADGGAGFEPLARPLLDIFGHDMVAIVDDNDVQVFAADGRGSVQPGAAGPLLAALVPTLGRARAMAQQKPGMGQAVSDYLAFEGRPVLASIMPLPDPARTLLHVSVKTLDGEVAQALGSGGLLDEPTFTTTRSDDPSRAVYPLIDANGRFVAFLEWSVFRPGRLVMQSTAPAIGVAVLVVTVMVLLLLDQIGRHSAALKSSRSAAQRQATHDPLTDLYNRSHFDAVLGRTLAAGNRREGLSLLMLDLDRFKHVNDTLGHEAGDELLRCVSHRLRGLVAPDDVIARLGGDEFGIIGQAADPQAALAQGNAIVEAMSLPFVLRGSEVFVGVSVGVVLAERRDRDRLELTRKADIALYEAKAGGRNRVVMFEPAMNELLQSRHRIEADLREALRRTDQISVAFQPLVEGRSGRVDGAEALVRWRHPTLGQVSPAQFVPIAEGTGLIESLGEVVLRQACIMGARWPGMTIAVNISPTQLRNPKFPDRVFALLDETGMRPDDLELEITEGILIEDGQVASESLRRFRTAGIKIALDDFGTGYSSLNYLKRYAVDRIKIDRSFVSQLAPDVASTAIVQAMITLAHALGIKTTAEGVETAEQMSALRAMGCDTYQGYLLSAPLSPADVEAVFNRDRNLHLHREARTA
ncbi:diguanylate cyclase (GGDEF) domain-containing protein [Devosia enhydra]|uniref:Diguanylate cyclase (GGDEF) domain-containing protein n=1 Tax=Devosia enhydra TaxID=665118 RepID=A0A1K2HWQ5_9HYPH|nr:bifunctional diguanylate cyclase/phosphodiesterase [Devosia enhydra]SFZ83152.1 diguanylate cyclase (GGDEF) domain-containing protein [Devosia enhydra]